ncbi:unnamed protein product [Euphydryas editha]|uniref:Reverse transcriptase domain-containing protein n=1 Tax=Euphydryas editha TaxID=104508 RepID=A0AAU9UXE2_EUPED|nr:unnamed protein product [Euphydryas editha]
MSASVHKLLIHGADIIKELPLPVGLFSEDVLETNQKEYKSIRLFHARKTSRIDTNTDIVHWMLIASDPVIASKRRNHNRKRKPFPVEVLEMLDVFLIEPADDDDGDEETVNDNDEIDRQGLAQGDPLSALLFNVATMSICKNLNDSIFISQYADDLAMSVTCKDINSAVSELQPALDRVTRLLGDLGLKISAVKSKTCLFNRSRKQSVHT